MSYRTTSMQQTPSARISMTRSAPQYRAASIYGGAGGHGARISSASASSLRSGAPVSSSGGFKLSSALGGGSVSGGFGGASTGTGAGILGNEKGAMQNLNDRLANYLDTVRNLEQANKKLEMNIREVLEKGGPDTRDYSKYEAIVDDLRREVRTRILFLARKYRKYCFKLSDCRIKGEEGFAHPAKCPTRMAQFPFRVIKFIIKL